VVRTNALNRDAQDQTPLLLHRLAVLVPVWVLPLDLPVPKHQKLHGFRQRNDLRDSMDLDKLGAVKLLAEN
jgi:hypothetical protein